MTPCSLVEVKRFVGKYCLHLHGRKVDKQATSKQKALMILIIIKIFFVNFLFSSPKVNYNLSKKDDDYDDSSYARFH